VRNRELVANVNKMKRCYKWVALPSPKRNNTSTWDPGEGIRQDMMEGKVVISPDQGGHLINLGSFDSALPAMNQKGVEHKTQDPTGCAERQQENPSSAEETMESGEGPGTRYGLWSEQGETAGAPDATQTERDEEKFDMETKRTESLTNSDIERGGEEGKRVSSPRYNLRSLPGQKLWEILFHSIFF
jgi:hypothetical protein